MTGFIENYTPGWAAWHGDPDDDAAHQAILGWLYTAVNDVFLDPQATLSNRVKGNLGEFIAYSIGKSYVFTNVMIADAANAWDPLADISRPDIDIVWLYFGPSQNDDWAAIQEVKTTGQHSLQVADGLISDYGKLFGENLRVTLRTRLGALRTKLAQRGHSHLAPRLTALGGPSPDEARGIRLLPTLVHDAAYNSSGKMSAVRQALIGNGWSTDVVVCWSIALGNLDRRLFAIAKGQ